MIKGKRDNVYPKGKLDDFYTYSLRKRVEYAQKIAAYGLCVEDELLKKFNIFQLCDMDFSQLDEAVECLNEIIDKFMLLRRKQSQLKS